MDTAKRRKLLVVLSGLLIAGALGAGRLGGLESIGSALMIAAAVLAGSDIALRAIRALFARHLSIELLVTVAAGGALMIGEYWESAAVTFLFVLGGYLEARTISRTRGVIQGLLEMAPTTAVVLRGDRQEEIEARKVGVGDLVLVKPGAKVPVDGEVVSGRSAVDESSITGEPVPAEKTEGSPVYAGTVNQAGAITLRTTGAGADTTLARIIRKVEEAQEEKAPTQRFMERFARWYTPAILVLSGVSFLLSRNLELALTVLVIGCPGALVISVPVSVVAGIGRAARDGILIKGGEHLEHAGRITAIALDKTGTLTRGKPEVTEVVPLGDGDGAGAGDAVLRLAAIAETSSEHPLARAIIGAAGDGVPQPDEFETTTGRGVVARYQGRSIAVGSPAFAAELGLETSPETDRVVARLSGKGASAVLVAVNGRVAGVIGVSDPVREEASEAVARLRSAGIERIVMLTGDNETTARAVAEAAGITDVRAALLPEQKLEAIRRLQAEGHLVGMVGDGVNDAPALAAADVGIAMGAAGSDVAIETAEVALMSDDLLKLSEAVGLSRRTRRNILQNVAVAVLTVAGLLTGVVLGEVHMAGGMLIHEASVLLVVLNATRLLRRSRSSADRRSKRGYATPYRLATTGPSASTGSGSP